MSEFFKELHVATPVENGPSGDPAAERHLRILADFGREVSGALGLDEIATVIVRRLIEVTDAERGLLLLAAPPGGLRVFKALDPCGVPLPPERSHYRRDVADPLVESGDARLVRGARPVIAVPLESGRGRFGVLYAEHAEGSGFEGEHLLLARLLATVASHAIELFRFEEERRRGEQIRLENHFLRQLSRRQTEQARVVEQLNRELEGRTRELTETSRFLEAVLESSTAHAIVAIDLAGTVTTFNTGATLIYGWAADEIVGKKDLSALFRADDRDGGLLEEMMQAAEAEPGGFTIETSRVGRSGDEVPVQTTLTAIRGADGRVTGYLDVSRNVGRERLLRQQVLMSEKMAALGTLAAGVAHEFNNLLQGIIGFLSHAIQRNDHGLSLRAMEVSLDAAQRAAALTGRLQAFARPNVAGLEPTDLPDIVEESLALVERSFVSDGIEVHRRYPPEVPPALADRSRLVQVLLNLLTNARHAMLRSESKRLTIETGTDGEWATLAVTDTGCGIPEEHLSRIFEPFFTTKGALGGKVYDGKIHGTGLGLAISSGIVLEHGGRIEVASRVGKGTTFKLRLRPAAAGRPRRRSVEDGSEKLPLAPSPLTVLVVDDETTIRDLLREVLESRGHRVMLADDGADGLARLGHERFDVVVADFQMPRLDGAGFFAALAAGGGGPRRVMITGRLEGEGNEPLALDAVLRKPFSIRQLIEAVEGGTGGTP